MELLMESENDEQVETLLAEAWQQFNSQNQLFSNKQGNEMLANILQKGKAYKTTPVITVHKRSFKWLGVAAAAIFFITTAGVYFLLKPTQS